MSDELFPFFSVPPREAEPPLVVRAGPAEPSPDAAILAVSWASSAQTDVVVVTSQGNFLMKPDHPRLAGAVIEAFVPPPVPLTPLSPRQLRRALLGAGINAAAVEAQIAGIADPLVREGLMIDWEYSLQFEREHPFIESVGSLLGLSSEAIDDLWRTALAL